MGNRYQFVVGLLTIINVLLTALLCGLLRDTRQDVNALRGILATKQDLVNTAIPKLTMFHEDKCTSCHTERKFAGPHNIQGQIEQALDHMSKMPDAPFTQEDVSKIHSSLVLFRCSQCHGTDKLRALVIESPADRMRIIQEMISKPNSKITSDETAIILRAFEQLLGF